MAKSTLLKPPPEDPNKSAIENLLDITELGVLGPDMYTNTRPQWHPPGARGLYGGSIISLCLAAGQRTVPEGFHVHSCHCYFLLAGSADLPIVLHVEKVRDGRSFATRTVQARQRGAAIFTTTMSFVRAGSSGSAHVRHAGPMPADAGAPPPDDWAGEPDMARSSPFQSSGVVLVGGGGGDDEVHARTTRQWVRARGPISAAGGHEAHLEALAYLSDSYFIGTLSRIHRLWRFPFSPRDVDKLAPEVYEHVRGLLDIEEGEDRKGAWDAGKWEGRPQVGMMVSLDHTIYFHEPLRVRADEWMFVEMHSPWAGDGRGVVYERIFARDGTLLATCVQEGLCRLKDTPAGGEGKGKL